MCTAGALNKKYLFKNRDMGITSGLGETIKRGYGVYRYIGVEGHATPRERGLNSGLNEKGISAEMTYVGNLDLNDAIDTSLPRGVLIESILGQAGNLEEALEIASRMLQRYQFVGGNILINTPQGSAVIEELYPRYCIERKSNEDTWFVKTNHFTQMILPVGFLKQEENSRIRYGRFEELLNRLDPDAATPEDIKNALADHANGDNAICRHGGNEFPLTVSTVIYDLEKLDMYYLYGKPCSTKLGKYSVAENEDER